MKWRQATFQKRIQNNDSEDYPGPRKKDEEKLTEPQRPVKLQILYHAMHAGNSRRKGKKHYLKK